MLAAWHDSPGPAAEVLQVGEQPDPVPGRGEVRVRLTISGINPGDTKKRSDWVSNGMPFPRVIPHSHGAGVVDAVGDGVASVAGRRTGLGLRRAVVRARSAPLLNSRSCPPIRRYRSLSKSATRLARASASLAFRDGALRVSTDTPLPLDRIAEAHDRVDEGSRKRVLLAIPH
jgi:hypothetical protein